MRFRTLHSRLFALLLGTVGLAFLNLPAVGQSSITGEVVECQDGTAAGYPCRNTDLLSYLSVEKLGGVADTDLNDVWGWTDPDTGTEYAIVGRTDGTAFVDVSSPTDPTYVGELPSHTTSSSWRDMKVYDNHVFVVSEAADHGMQVFDLTRLRTVGPEERPVTFEETAHYAGIETAHNVAINTDTGFAYIVGGGADDDTTKTCGGGLHMVNVQDPTVPSFAGCFPNSSSEGEASAPRNSIGAVAESSPHSSNAQQADDSGYTHDTQCVTYRGPDAAYQGRELCFNANESVLNVADVTDKDAPTTVSEFTYPDVGYVHQAWLTEDHRYLYIDDEFDERNGLVDSTRTIVFDVSDLDAPTLVTTYAGPTGAIDHNQYIDGHYAYQANYTSGLRVLDVADPKNPAGVAFFDTHPGDNTASFNGAWSTYPFFERNVVLISSIEEGLFVVEPEPPPILSVTATRQEQDAFVQWTVSAIAQTVRSVVEHKPPGARTWQRAGTVPVQNGSSIQKYAYTLSDLSPGRHQVRVRHVSSDGTSHTSETREVRIRPSTSYLATGPAPNPVQLQATFTITLRQTQRLRIALYDLLGRRVEVLHRGRVQSGVTRRFRIRAGRRASGVYVLRVQGESVQLSREVVVAR